ncbi:hypothetical protein D1007_43402 [Hordeum vulgare]|nr:hypothetical protein D1007_43402 [Hordeum vulgare]
MKEHFDLHNKSGIDRTEISLRSLWSTVNRDCQAWEGALKAVDTLNPSGTTEIGSLLHKLISRRGEEDQERKDQERETIYLAPLL